MEIKLSWMMTSLTTSLFSPGLLYSWIELNP